MSCTRRELLKAGLFGLLALPLAGCGGASGPVSKAPAETLRVIVPALLPALDPHAWSDATGPRTLDPLFDALTFIQSDGQLRPALAVAWSQPSPTSWQFRLRADDAKFHTGEMFTPDSVRFTFDRPRSASAMRRSMVRSVSSKAASAS